MKFSALFIIVAITALPFHSLAQYKFGVKGGVGISDYVGKDAGSKRDPKMGITAGLFYEREINLTLSIGAELNYEKKGTYYEFYPRDETVVAVDSRLTYISMPVTVKAYYGSHANFYIYLGLTPSRLSDSKLTYSATELGYPISSEPFFNYEFKRWDASVTAGFGLNIYEIIVDIRYDHGIANVYVGHNVPSIRNHFISATLGFTIYKKKVLKCFNY